MSRHTRFLIALLLCLPATSAAAADGERIVNGTEPNQPWPAQAYVTRSDSNAVCGGTLVSGLWVLTAGHCVSNLNGTVVSNTALTVVLGRTDITSPVPAANTYSVVPFGILRHELYAVTQPGVTYDLALLRLDRVPPLEPMRLVTDAESALWAPGTIATVIGWGAPCSGCSTVSNLRQAGVRILDDPTCAQKYAGNPGAFNATTMLCAGEGVSDTCSGDSGGPLLVPRVDRWALAGVTSWAIGCNDPRYPGVYVRLGAKALNDWVRGRIPTTAIQFSPQSPQPGQDVALTAVATQPAGTKPTRTWDLDDDGAYDDAAGATATLPAVTAGSHVVRVQDAYPDGDRAFAREVVTTAGSPPPPPQPPPPPPPEPGTTGTTARTGGTTTEDIPRQAPDLDPFRPLAEFVLVPARVRLRSLLDRRLAVRLRCSRACSLFGRLLLDARSARRAGIGRSATVATRIGEGRELRTRAATFRLTLRLSARAVRALRRLRRATLTVAVTARGGLDREDLRRRVAYRR